MLELLQVTKRFSADPKVKPAVDQANFQIRDGEFFSLLGPSGCGKTTLLRMLAGFETPTAGEIHYNRDRIDTLAPNVRPFNLVFQRYALFPHLTVLQNIEFGLKLKRLSHSEIRSRTDEVMALVKLEGYESRHILTLSGGQQQRVALARALVNRPKVLLLDEPLSALDLKLRQQMQGELRSIQKHLKSTFIFVTHDQEEAMALSDRIAVMNEGQVEQIASPREIYDQPETLFVANFIGTANLVDAEIVDLGDRGEVILKNPRSQMPPLSGAQIPTDLRVGERVKLLLRPEKLKLSSVRPAKTESRAQNFLEVVVKDALFQGANTHYFVQPQGMAHVLWTVSVPSREEEQPLWSSMGNQAFLSWNWQDARVLRC